MKSCGYVVITIIVFVLVSLPTTALENPNSLPEDTGATDAATPKAVIDQQTVETLILTPEDLVDGRSYPIQDMKITVKRQEEAWAFSLIDAEDKELENVTMPMTVFHGKELNVKFVVTIKGDDVTMKSSAGAFIQVSAEQLLNGRHYSCPDCGLIVVVNNINDKGEYVCPNDGTEMVTYPARHSKKSTATFIGKTEGEKGAGEARKE